MSYVSVSRTVLAVVAVLLAWGAGSPAESACEARPVKEKKPPFVMSGDVVWVSAANDGTGCELHGPITLTLDEGTLLATTLTFEDGTHVVVDWARKVADPSDLAGVKVDFQKGTMTVDGEKVLSRCEFLVSFFSRGKKPFRYTRAELLGDLFPEPLTIDLD